MIRLFLAAAFVALALAYAGQFLYCGLPVGEQCGTDTECECLHGAE